jgi:hypothetical protein
MVSLKSATLEWPHAAGQPGTIQAPEQRRLPGRLPNRVQRFAAGLP